MTYNVFGGTLNPAQLNLRRHQKNCLQEGLDRMLGNLFLVMGVINYWNSLPADCVNCSLIDTLKSYVSVALEPEMDCSSKLTVLGTG